MNTDIKDEELTEKIIKNNIPNGVINIRAKGKGNGKPQYKAEIDAIKKCMQQYAASKTKDIQKDLDLAISEIVKLQMNQLTQ